MKYSVYVKQFAKHPDGSTRLLHSHESLVLGNSYLLTPRPMGLFREGGEGVMPLKFDSIEMAKRAMGEFHKELISNSWQVGKEGYVNYNWFLVKEDHESMTTATHKPLAGCDYTLIVEYEIRETAKEETKQELALKYQEIGRRILSTPAYWNENEGESGISRYEKDIAKTCEFLAKYRDDISPNKTKMGYVVYKARGSFGSAGIVIDSVWSHIKNAEKRRDGLNEYYGLQDNESDFKFIVIEKTFDDIDCISDFKS